MKRIPSSGQISPDDPLAYYFQNGVRPGPRKLSQFQKALQLRGTPVLYSQDGKGDEAIAYVKLFDPCGSATWHLLEWDGREEAFGFVTGLGFDELGYISLRELAEVQGRLGIGIEIDTSFRPTPLTSIRSKK